MQTLEKQHFEQQVDGPIHPLRRMCAKVTRWQKHDNPDDLQVDQGMPRAYNNGEHHHSGSRKEVAHGMSRQPVPRLHSVVYGHNFHAHHARCWAHFRCGHHVFADKRSARHRNTCLSTPCRLCSLGFDSLEHALLQCPAHTLARNRWRRHPSH